MVYTCQVIHIPVSAKSCVNWHKLCCCSMKKIFLTNLGKLQWLEMAFFPIPITKRYYHNKNGTFPSIFPSLKFHDQVHYEAVLFSLIIPHLMPSLSFSRIKYLFIKASLCKYHPFKCECLINLNFQPPNWLINENIGFKWEKFAGWYLVLFQTGAPGKAKQISSRMFVEQW